MAVERERAAAKILAMSRLALAPSTARLYLSQVLITMGQLGQSNHK